MGELENRALMPARQYLVSGRVQGVGFRWFVLEEAQALALRGEVRNLRDGRVEVLAAGPAGALDQLERILRQGPRFAHVVAVEVSELKEPGRLPADFRIAH